MRKFDFCSKIYPENKTKTCLGGKSGVLRVKLICSFFLTEKLKSQKYRVTALVLFFTSKIRIPLILIKNYQILTDSRAKIYKFNEPKSKNKAIKFKIYYRFLINVTNFY